MLIFDVWDELILRQYSLAAGIIHEEILAKCSVIVTSHSYTSFSLLEISSINRHIEVVGFSVKEIQVEVKGTLEKEPHLAKKNMRLYTIICSIAILVYHKSNMTITNNTYRLI